MKYIYKKQYKYIMKYTNPAQIITAIMMGEQPKPEAECVGAAFYPNGNDKDADYIEKHNIELTPVEVFKRNEDQQIKCLDYLSDYMPKSRMIKFDGPAYATRISSESFNNNPREEGIIGKWTEDLDKNAKLYYYVMGDVILPMFIVMDTELGLTNSDNVLYVIKLNNMMMDCSPDEGDVIFSSEKEAKNYIKNNKKQIDINTKNFIDRMNGTAYRRKDKKNIINIHKNKLK